MLAEAKSLIEIRAGGLGFPHRVPQLVRRRQRPRRPRAARAARNAAVLVQLPHRGQDARTGEMRLLQLSAQVEVCRFADALHRRKAVEHRDARVLHAGREPLFGRVTLRESPVLVEVPQDVYVDVDEARQ